MSGYSIINRNDISMDSTCAIMFSSDGTLAFDVALTHNGNDVPVAFEEARLKEEIKNITRDSRIRLPEGFEKKYKNERPGDVIFFFGVGYNPFRDTIEMAYVWAARWHEEKPVTIELTSDETALVREMMSEALLSEVSLSLLTYCRILKAYPNLFIEENGKMADIDSALSAFADEASQGPRFCKRCGTQIVVEDPYAPGVWLNNGLLNATVCDECYQEEESSYGNNE